MGEDIPHANIVNRKWRYTNNQRADYECEEGYKGRPTRTCGENGWTGDSQCTGEEVQYTLSLLDVSPSMDLFF